MYIIKNGNRIVWGPKIWDKSEFQSIIFEEFGINFPLQWANPNEKVINVNDDVSIWPVIFRSDPSYNKRIEMLDGPFYDYTETHAEQYHTVIDLSLDQVKFVCKDAIVKARNFWTNTNGLSVTVNGNSYYVSVTDERRRDFDFGVPGNWKMRRVTSTDSTGLYDRYTTQDEWVTMTQEGLDSISSQIKTHIQNQFDINKTQFEIIDGFTTIEEATNHTFPDGVDI
jgi:hypothetical protein